MRKYNLVVCGGTFDHFHKGHKEFLRFGLFIGSKLLLGLTTDKYIKNSKLKTQNSKLIEDYNTRKESIVSFLKKERALNRVEVQPINDICIPKIWEELPIESIIVSKNTIDGAKQINLKRQEQKKYPLKIEIVQLVKSDDNEYISSSRIRGGEINREGKVYVNPLWLKQKLFITDRLRQELKKPFGTLLKSSFLKGDSGQARITQSPYIITVGDVTTRTFNDLSINQNISAIDFKVSRKKCFSNIRELGFLGKEKIVRVDNPAGVLTPTLFKAILRIVKLRNSKNRLILKVNGEEDLSVLPLALTLPLGAVIFYGQPGEGVVRVNITEEAKKAVYNFMSQFKLSRSISAIDK